MPSVLSVNLGRLQANADPRRLPTGIDKQPVSGPVWVRAPGSKLEGLGSGVVGDEIGNRSAHGGDGQAVYAYAREDLDAWSQRLGRPLPGGAFGENLTTQGLEVSEALIGERWLVGSSLVLQVTSPRIPCGTFRAHMAVKGWLKLFTQAARSGAYLSVVTPGPVQAGDPIRVVHRPEHAVTSRLAFRALTRERDLLPSLLAAGGDLPEELQEMARAGQTYSLG